MTRAFRDRTSWVASRIPPGTRRLLDVGCHAGIRTESYAHHALEVVGVDTDEAAIDEAIARRSGVSYVRGRAEMLEFPDGHFDVVICSEVLEHIPRDQEARMLAGLARVLRPGGRLIITVPHRGLFHWLDPMDARSRLRRLSRRLRGDGALAVWSTEKGHYHYALGELLTLLRPHFDIDDVYRSALLLHPINTALLRSPRPLRRISQALADWEYRHAFGPASYNLGIVATRGENATAGDRRIDS